MRYILKEMVDWAHGLSWETLPPEVRERAKWAIIDPIATMVGGRDTRAAVIALDFAENGAGKAALVGRAKTTSAEQAAFGNAVAASALDFDDGHYLGGGIHPGSVVVPAILSVADENTTVEQAAFALVVGYEIGLRAAYQLWGRHPEDLYHCTGTGGAIAAAAAVATLNGADADELLRAVRIAWVHAPMSTFGLPMVKESIGWGAKTGVAAAQLAAAGFMKVPDGYEVPRNDVLPESPFERPGAESEDFVTNFGKSWTTLGTYFKPFAACRYTHAAGAGMLKLMADNNVSAEEIEQVKVGTPRAATFLNEVDPRTIDNAQYSFPVVLASLALWGRAGGPEISDESLFGEPERLEFAKKVTLSHAPELEQYYPARYPSHVEIVTSKGSFSGQFLDAPGDPGTDFDQVGLRDKWVLLFKNGGIDTAIIDALSTDSTKLLQAVESVWAKPAN